MSDPEVPRGPSRPVLTHPRHRRSTLVWVILGLIALVAVIAFFVWRGQHSAQQAASSRGGRGDPRGMGPAVMPVGTATVKQADVPVYLTGLGTVTPRATVTVHSRVNGQLMSVNYTEGQLVKQNQLLAVIDPRPYEAALKQAEGALQRDQALLADAKLDLQRYATLLQQDSIAKQTYDTQAALVQQDEGTVKADEGNVDTAKVNLIYTRITAPVSGRVGLRPVDPGNIVSTTDTNGVAVITQLQPIDVIYTIPQDDIAAVAKPMREGQTLPVDAYDRTSKNKLASGSLLTVDNQIDVSTGTVRLKGTFANSDLVLFPNQFVNIQMLVNTLKGATTVPTSAVQRGAQGTYAYVVNADNTVSVRPITTIVTTGDTVAVATGLTPGDVVVIDGADKLREGAKVDPVDRAKPSAAPAAAPSGQHAGGHRHNREAAADSAQGSSSAR